MSEASIRMSQGTGTPVDPTEVDIAPDVRVLGVFRHLNYKPWYALAEFVDNALDSFLTNRRAIQSLDGRSAKLVVRVVIDTSEPGTITVVDNAAGISSSDWRRALKPAEPPPSSRGLSEFGMGMKTAACWFGRQLDVESTALGDCVRRSAHLDFDGIVTRRVNTVRLVETRSSLRKHGTVVTVQGLHRPLQTRTLGKIHDHLSSMFRVFLRDGTLDLVWQAGASGVVHLQPEQVQMLTVPRFDDPRGEAIEWRKQIRIDLGEGVKVRGWAALRARGSTSKAGFALFRAGRLIQGSDDETYRPQAIFGASTTAVYQRLFGELHVSGLAVAHTKDGFRWDDKEERLIEELRRELDQEPMPLIAQARHYSYGLQRRPERELQSEAENALESTAVVIQRELPDSESAMLQAAQEEPPLEELSSAQELLPRTFTVEVRGESWEITTEFSNDTGPAIAWVERAHRQVSTAPGSPHVLRLRLALNHPFTERYMGVDYENLELLLRFGVSVVLAEVLARQGGARGAGEVCRQINLLLRDVLSHG